MILSELSAQEINRLIAEIIYHDVDEVDYDYGGETAGAHVIFKSGVKGGVYDWVNDDALAFRLMVDNGMNFKSLTVSGSFAANDARDVYVASISESPNRAIAECFLLINGVES